jgi:hypothetical protein
MPLTSTHKLPSAHDIAMAMLQLPVDKDIQHVKQTTDFAALPRPVQARAVQLLRMHVMDNVRQRIEAGHMDFVNEIRVCTCLFIGFPSLKVSSASGRHLESVYCPLAHFQGACISCGALVSFTLLSKVALYMSVASHWLGHWSANNPQLTS